MPFEKYVIVQLIYTFLASCAMFISGIAIGWSSTAVPQLLHGEANIILTADETSWVASLLSFGQLGGVFYVRYGNDLLGRKISILITFILDAVGWLFLVFGREVWHLYLGRIIFGLSSCVCWGTIPLYIGEISSKNIRGRFCSLPVMMTNAGSLAAYVIGAFTTYNTTIYIYIAITVLCFLVCLTVLPESPYLLVKNEKQKQAENVLIKLRAVNDKELVQNDLKHIQYVVSTDMQRQTSYKEMFLSSRCRKGLVIVTALKVFQQASGIHAISSYAQTIFDNTSMQLSGSMSSIIYGVTKLLAGIVPAIFMDSFGRRKLTLTSFIGVAVALGSIGSYFFIQDYVKATLEVMNKINWIPLTATMLFSISFSIGIGPITAVLNGELFATNIKGPATSVGILFLTISQLITVKMFQSSSDAWGAYVPFWSFTCFMVCGIVFTIFFVPETKGKTFDEIQNMLKPKKTILQTEKYSGNWENKY